MNKFAMLCAVTALLGIAGFLYAGRESRLPVPDQVKAIECPKDSKFHPSQGYAVVKVKGTTLVFACENQAAIDAAQDKWWKMEKHPDQNNREIGGAYHFVKKSDGRFALEGSPSARYKLEASYADHAFVVQPFDEGRYWKESVPTPTAFSALAGPETLFSCQGPSIHPEMNFKCYGDAQTKGLFWRILVSFNKPLRDESGEYVDEKNFDVRPEIAEAYQLLAAHILKQE